jgi:hypothetical protein
MLIRRGARGIAGCRHTAKRKACDSMLSDFSNARNDQPITQGVMIQNFFHIFLHPNFSLFLFYCIFSKKAIVLEIIQKIQNPTRNIRKNIDFLVKMRYNIHHNTRS